MSKEQRPHYEIETFAVGSFQCNCSLLINTETKTAMVVDPGDEPFAILERLDYHELTLTTLWHTHAHLDHIGATKFLYDEYSRRNQEKGLAKPVIYLHPDDKWLYDNVAIQSQMLGLHTFEVEQNYQAIAHHQKYAGFAGVKALHTPGHTPGSCCLDVRSEISITGPRNYSRGFSGPSTHLLFSGDTLFKGSVGRTDLWGGDTNLMLNMIKSRVLSLTDKNTDDCLVIPGHGPLTSIESEKRSNPFLS